jgi:N-acetyl-gamma-glutamyl-phosphate reductase
MTHAGPFVRGIHLTLHAELNGSGARAAERTGPREWYERAYRGRPFVRLLSEPPELTHAIGTNHALIHVAASEDGTEVQVMVAVDNLIKGAAGQAVQAMNLALGLPEDAGLRLAGAWPC